MNESFLNEISRAMGVSTYLLSNSEAHKKETHRSAHIEERTLDVDSAVHAG